MKKSLFYLAAAAFLLVACNNKEEAEKQAAAMAEVEAKYQEASTFNDSLMLLMGDIYAGLDSINTQEGILLSMGNGDNGNSREEIKANLSAIRMRLENNKLMLAQLEKKAAESGNQSKVLQKTIDQMKVRIAAQDEKINELTTQLNETKEQLTAANEQITTLSDQVEETQQQLSAETKAKEEVEANLVASENAANQVYYVIGTNKQLKDWKVLEKRFLGATKVMQGDNINYTCFKAADKRNLTSIPTGAKKVEIKSINDKESYVIEGAKDGPKTIKITNPELFWQKTPYLVIQID